MSAEIIERLYTAFDAKNAAGMAACYHPDVTFTDPAFGSLRGWKAAAMWHMLIERGTDLRMEHSRVQATDHTGSAHWEAWYTFSITQRSVHNIIDASFRFQAGRIIEPTDVFDFWRWSRQALGAPGIFLGWSGMLSAKVNKTANQGLESWIKKNGFGPGLIPPI